jgi:Family of unknown function (DUF5947)
MSSNGGGRAAMEQRVAARRRADLVSGLRRLAQRTADEPRSGPRGSIEGAVETCELCRTDLGPDHRHMINLEDRRLVCVCDGCWAIRSDDAELRPTGVRVVFLDDFHLPEELWAKLEIPIGLAFLMHSGADGRAAALYPSPAGATESEIAPVVWEELKSSNPQLRSLLPDAEAVVVNRLHQPHQIAIAPIDQCYRLVGMIKVSWEGISGGEGPRDAAERFFEELRSRGQGA